GLRRDPLNALRGEAKLSGEQIERAVELQCGRAESVCPEALLLGWPGLVDGKGAHGAPQSAWMPARQERNSRDALDEARCRFRQPGVAAQQQRGGHEACLARP